MPTDLAAAAGTSAGASVTIALPLLVFGVLALLIRYAGHKAATAVLGFVLGLSLAGTAIGNAAADIVTRLVHAL